MSLITMSQLELNRLEANQKISDYNLCAESNRKSTDMPDELLPIRWTVFGVI